MNDTRPERHFGCYRVIDTIERLCADNGIEIAVRVPVHQDWRNGGRAEAIAGCHLVIVNGEGTIHHDRTAGVRLVEAGVFARDHGIPAALINTSWHANSAPLAERAVGFARIAVRETGSAAELHQAGTRADVMPDLSIHFLQAATGRRAGRVVIDSVVFETSWALAVARRRLAARPLSISASWGMPRDLLAMAAQSGLRAARGSDRVYALRAAVDLWRGRQRSAAEFERALGEAAIAITGRFHAAMIALALGTPVVAIESNTPKIGATFADAGLDAKRIVPSVEALNRRDVATLARWSPEEAEALRTWLAEGRRRQAALFADLAALAR